MGQIGATGVSAAVGANEGGVDMAAQTRSCVTDGLHSDIVGISKLYTCDGKMSTTLRKRTPAVRADQPVRQLELALGVELNALLSASTSARRPNGRRIPSRSSTAAFHLARWLYAYGPVQPSTLAEAVAWTEARPASSSEA